MRIDAIYKYREATNRMGPSTNTFICSVCNGFHEIAGRKKSAQIGRRVMWKCAVCVKDGK